jgi:methionine synthase I (cobalamin-dependent)
MGTRLVARGLSLDTDDPALWNLTHPAEVADLHALDVAAGSEVLLTNTFGGNRAWLDRYGLGHAVAKVNRTAAELARESAGPARFVLGDMGPSAAGQKGAAAEQAAILVESGVDGILLETFRAGPVEPVLAEVSQAIAGAVPIIVSLWEWPEPSTALAKRLLESGASVLGMNCRGGIDAAVAFAEQMSQLVSCPLLLKPSAAPGSAESAPAAFASLAERVLDKNVCFLGGCCGTTEAHVTALALALHAKGDGPRRRSGVS